MSSRGDALPEECGCGERLGNLFAGLETCSEGVRNTVDWWQRGCS